MATNIWNGNGNWNTDLLDWSLSAAPTASNNALIATGSVTLTASGVAAGVTVLAPASFYVGTGGALNATNLSVLGAFSLDPNFGQGGDSVTLTGTFSNSGGVTLGNNGLSASSTLTAAHFSNIGTINVWGNQTLGTSFQTTLNITSAAPSVLTGIMGVHGDADVEFASGGITTIANNAVLRIDGSQARVSIGASTANSALSTLTTILGALELEGDTNSGSGGGSVTTPALFNSGNLLLDVNFGAGASSMTIGGTLTNAGIVTVGNTGLSASDTLTVSGLANTGNIVLWGNNTLGTSQQATFNDTGAAPTAWTGNLSVHGDADVKFGSGGITSIASGAQLLLEGAQARVSIGASTANSALSGLAANFGVFDEEGDSASGAGGGVAATSANFVNYAAFDLDVTYGHGASTFTDTGVFTNDDNLYIGNSGLSANSTMTVADLVNNGTIYLASQPTGGVGQPQAVLNVLAAAPTASTGFLRVQGNSLINFSSGAITSISGGAEIELDGSAASIAIGAGAANSALTTLASNAGTLLLRGDNGFGNGVALTTTTAFANSGSTLIDYYYGDGGSNVTFGGALTNSGTLYIGDNGLAGDTTVTAASLTNTGSLTVQGSSAGAGSPKATLNIAAAAAATVSNFIRVAGDATLDFGSGTGPSSIAFGGWLELDSAQANIDIGAGAQNSGVAKLAANTGNFLLRGGQFGLGGVNVTTSVGFTNRGTSYIDAYGYGDGGSTFNMGGVLANFGAFYIGNTGLAASALVTTTKLNNSGTLIIQGAIGASGPNAALDVSGAALSQATNFLRVGGNATLDFGSGGIVTVAKGGWVELDGQYSNIQSGAGTQNSGLSGLTRNSGNLLLRGNTNFGVGGVSLGITGAFANIGTLYVDAYGYGDGGSALTFASSLVNQGTLAIGNTGLSASTAVQAVSLVNNGSLTLQGNATPGAASATLTLTGGSLGAASGFIRVGGDANLIFNSGTGLGSIAAGGWLELDSAQANIAISGSGQNSGLANLARNSGTFMLRGDTNFGAGGVTVTTTTNLFNTGTAYVDAYGYGDGASSLTIGGTLANQGNFYFGNTGLSAASTLKATNLNNLSGTLTLVGSSNIATMTVSGAAVNNANVSVGAGAVLAVTGSYVQNGGATTINGAFTSGGYTQNGGSTTVNSALGSTILNDRGGTITFNAALGASGSPTTLNMANGAALNFAAGVSASQTVTFQDATDTLGLTAPGSFNATIGGFVDGDAIDLFNQAATSVSFASGVLNVFNGATQIAALHMTGSYTTSSFALAGDNHGGTLILT